MEEVKPDYAVDLSEELTEEELAEIHNQEKMKILWCIEQDAEKKVIEIRPGSSGHISLHGAHEIRHFADVLNEVLVKKGRGERILDKEALIESKKQQIENILLEGDITFGIAQTIIHAIEADLLKDGSTFLNKSGLKNVLPSKT